MQDKMKDALRRESLVDIQDDGDPYWFNNPQYRLTVDEPTEVGSPPNSLHFYLYRFFDGIRGRSRLRYFWLVRWSMVD